MIEFEKYAHNLPKDLREEEKDNFQKILHPSLKKLLEMNIIEIKRDPKLKYVIGEKKKVKGIEVLLRVIKNRNPFKASLLISQWEALNHPYSMYIAGVDKLYEYFHLHPLLDELVKRGVVEVDQKTSTVRVKRGIIRSVKLSRYLDKESRWAVIERLLRPMHGKHVAEVEATLNEKKEILGKLLAHHTFRKWDKEPSK